jgi:hypothetical protein
MERRLRSDEQREIVGAVAQELDLTETALRD